MDPFNSNLRKLQEAWEVFDEAMKEYGDDIALFTPTNREFFIYQVTPEGTEALKNSLMDEFFPYVLSSINIRFGSDYNEVDSVFAQKGWGPLTYYTVLSSISPEFLAPTQQRGQVTDVAASVWSKMPEEYVEKKKLSDVHEKEILNYAYRATKDLLRKMKNPITKAKSLHKSYVESFDYPDEAENLIHEASNTLLDRAMAKIYR